MGLSVREILILDYFDGKPVHAKMPSYLYATLRQRRRSLSGPPLC